MWAPQCFGGTCLGALASVVSSLLLFSPMSKMTWRGRLTEPHLSTRQSFPRCVVSSKMSEVFSSLMDKDSYRHKESVLSSWNVCYQVIGSRIYLSCLPGCSSQQCAHPIREEPLFWFKCLLSTNPVSVSILGNFPLLTVCFNFLFISLNVTPSIVPWHGPGAEVPPTVGVWVLLLSPCLKGFVLKIRKNNYTSLRLLNYAPLTSETFCCLYLDMAACHACANCVDGEEIHLLKGNCRCLF